MSSRSLRILLSAVLFFSVSGNLSGQTGKPLVSSSNSGPSAFSGININEFVGADRFYQAGFTGTRTLLGNIEGGKSGTTHNAMSNVTEEFLGTGVNGTDHDHAAATSHAMSGSVGGTYDGDNSYWGYGVAFDSETWSGDIATGFNSNGSYQLTWASIASTYGTLLETGINGRTVDVFNSSWGFTNPTGTRRDTMGVDGLINRNGTVAVVSAGNDGPGSDTVGGIGAGYNSITVGATGSDTSSTPYGAVTSFSSRGANSFALATSPNGWNVIDAQTAQRAAVDIVAPGQNMTLARPSSGSNWYGFNWGGTSFSAPTVAGGAGLVVDAGKAIYQSDQSIDGRVIKAVLLNSANKLSGWDNGQINLGGIVSTSQSLDFEQGAGQLDLNQAFDQYVNFANGGLAGTTDVAGELQGDLGNVDAVGWDFGVVDAESSNSYFIDSLLDANSQFNVTLTWFADRDPSSTVDFGNVTEEHLADLNLRIFQFDNLVDRNDIGTVAESISDFNVVEHLSFELDATGFYGIEVSYNLAHWNFTGETDETYGISWFGEVSPVPEPSSVWIGMIASGLLLMKRRRGPAGRRGLDC